MTDSPSPSDTPALTEGGAPVGWAYRDAMWIDEGRWHLCKTEPGRPNGREVQQVYLASDYAALLARAEAAEKELDTRLDELGWVIMACLPGMRTSPTYEGVRQMRAHIDALTAKVARLTEALEPFAAAGNAMRMTGGTNPKMSGPRMAEHLERARAALSPVKQEPNHG